MKLSDCDAVILAGGLGTRIKDALPVGCPKAMADINGKPFIKVLLDHLRAQGFEKFTLCVGYGQEQIIEAVTKEHLATFVCEHEQMGTGAAIRLMLRSKVIKLSDPFFVFNGDTISYGVPYDGIIDAFTWPEFPTAYLWCRLITTFRYANKNVGTFMVRNNARLRNAIEWEPREKFNLEDLPIHGDIGIINVTEPFIDIGIPDGLRMARERF